MKTIRNSAFLAALLIAAVTLAVPGAAFAQSSEATPAPVEVNIDNFSFMPQELNVKAGTPIIWKNRDDIPHTVVSTDSLFKSKALDTDDQFSFTPMKPGTYTYFCSIHPKMTAKLVVH